MPDYDPAERLEQGERYNREQRYFEAIDAFEDAILANYKTDQAYYGLYIAYSALGRGIEAQEALRRSRPSVYEPTSPEERPCARCGGIAVLQTEYPNRASGYTGLVLGLLFAPFCIGFFIILYAIHLMNDAKQYWQCQQCGTTFPA